MKNKVKEFRLKLGISQDELANKAGISRPYLCEIENHKQTEIGSSVMFKISKALGVDISEIFFAETVVLKQQK